MDNKELIEEIKELRIVISELNITIQGQTDPKYHPTFASLVKDLTESMNNLSEALQNH